MKEMKQHQRGQGLVEYGLILILVALVVILAITQLGNTTRDKVDEVSSALDAEFTPGPDQGTYCESDMTSSDGWQYEGAGTDSWQIIDGKMCRDTKNQMGFAYSQCSQTEQMRNAEDYVIYIEDVVLSKGDGFGIMFRLQDYDANPNGYAFQYDPGMHGIVFRKWVNGWEIWNPLAFKQLDNYEWYDVPRDIKISVEGKTMKAYIDGELMLTAKDDTYSSGGVGLRTWSNTLVCFEDFSINEAE